MSTRPLKVETSQVPHRFTNVVVVVHHLTGRTIVNTHYKNVSNHAFSLEKKNSVSAGIEYNSTRTFNLMYHSASFYPLSPIAVIVAAAGPHGFSLKIKNRCFSLQHRI